MATVATLAVNVIAQTGKFDQGMDKAGTKAKGFGKSVGGANSGMKKMIGVAAIAAAGMAALGKAIGKVSDAMKRLDEVAKKARALGITGQDLMEFQHAAELAGVQAGSFTSALQKMQKNIGDAIAGIGLAKDSLALVGLEIGDLAKLDASEQFLAIADKISKIENASERAAVATSIFGRAGADLIPLMIQGSDAIRAQMEDLRLLQGVMSEADFQAIEDANDAWTRLGKVMDGVWNKVAVEVAPAFEGLVNIMIDLSTNIDNINEKIENMGGHFDSMKDFLPPFLQKQGELWGKAWDWLVKMGTKELTAAEKAAEAAAELLQDQVQVAEEALKAHAELETKGLKLLESLRTPMEMYTDTIDNLNMMLEAGVISWETYGRAVEKAQEDIKKSDEFAAKEIRVAERQAVGAALRGRGAFSIQQKQHRVLEKIREEERLQLKQLQQQTSLLQQLNNNVQIGVVVGI